MHLVEKTPAHADVRLERDCSAGTGCPRASSQRSTVLVPGCIHALAGMVSGLAVAQPAQRHAGGSPPPVLA